MKYLLICVIKIYWFLTPKSKRKKCIFRTSCSNHVFEITSKNGFWEGLRVLKFRYENCRHGYQIFTNPMNHKINLILPNRDIIDEENIAERLLK